MYREEVYFQKLNYIHYNPLQEANDWYRNGKGEALYVNAEKIDLTPVTVSELKNAGGEMFKNFFLTTNTKTGMVYGTIKITLSDADNGTVKLGGTGGFLDRYDFEQKPSNGTWQRAARNFGTKIGELKAGKGTPFKIFNYGNGFVERE